MQPLAELTDRLAADRRLDSAERVVERASRALVRNEGLRAALGGAWLGHPLHPVLTDLPIGFWTSSFVLDLGGDRYQGASDALIAAGVASALPAVAAGLVDWRQLDRSASRIGVLHAASNGAALALYAASLLARRRGRRASGLALSTAGGAVASVGGYLGGRLAFEPDPGPAVDAPGADADETGPDDRVDPGR